MPAYLPEYLRQTTAESWRHDVLQAARESANEGVAICEKIREPEARFYGSVALARVELAEGNRAAAIERLQAILAASTRDQHLAETHFRLWKAFSAKNADDSIRTDAELASTDRDAAEKHRTAAIELYEQVYAKTPQLTFKERLEVLTRSEE